VQGEGGGGSLDGWAEEFIETMRREEGGLLLNPGTRRFVFLLITYIYAKRCGHPSHCNILPKTTTHCNKIAGMHHTYVWCMKAIFPLRRRIILGWRKSLQDTAKHCETLQNAATHCNTQQHSATHWNTRDTMHHIALICTTLHHTVPHRVTLHRTATHCITLQHTVTRWAEEGNGNHWVTVDQWSTERKWKSLSRWKSLRVEQGSVHDWVGKKENRLSDALLPLRRERKTCRTPTNLHGVDRSARRMYRWAMARQ